MRLLRHLPSDNFELVSVKDDDPPPYAILSHTWTGDQEVTYGELLAGAFKEKAGYNKIRFCVSRAAQDGLQYSWVDTCCINKSVSDELSTAINSMFRWYQRASKCYVYLSDVRVPDGVSDTQVVRMTWEEAFRQSRWFKRGWTLQELLAPAEVEFFSENGRRLGSRMSLEKEIHEITGIPVGVLRGQRFADFSVEERMSWAAKRNTTLKEDKIYCLLGIFEVFLPLIYGEGEAYATLRLKEEIRRRREGRGAEGVEDLTVYSLLPFPKNEHFIGREEQLQCLENSLLVPDSHRRTTIYGLGGSGKSALALEFAYRTLARVAGCQVFWVPAMSRESFELAYRDIGIRLQIPGITDDNADYQQLVKRALSSANIGHWLMIVDNVDDPEVLLSGASSHSQSARLHDYLPYSNGSSILFTTRSKKAAGDLTQSSVLELDDMSKAEARHLLEGRILRRSLLDDEEAIGTLLDSLAYLPLAIVQAVAFINNNEISVSKYISLFRDAETELLAEHFEDPNRYRDMESTISRTWHISFDHIRRQDPLAAEYLSFMACIDRINIPESLLPPGPSPLQQAKAIGTLKGYAFITERQQIPLQGREERFFDIHRLVHLASICWLTEHSNWADWVCKAGDRLKHLIPYGGYENKETWTIYLPHALHIATCHDTLDGVAKAELLYRVGGCQFTLGQYVSAEATQRKVLSLREKALGKEHAETLKSMNAVGILLANQGKYEQAESMNRQTLVRSEQVLGPEHPDTLMKTSNLAATLNMKGRYNEAESLQKQTLVRREKVLGLKHPDTLTSMNNLALILYNQGKYEEAESMQTQALVRREEVLGTDDPDTLTSRNNLADMLSLQGKYEEAELMNRQTLALSERVLGLEHPDTITSMNNLANVLFYQGKYEEAEAMQKKTLAQREKVLGLEHPSTLTSMNNLALILDSQNNSEEAESMQRRTLAGRQKVLGLEHPSTLTSMNNLALILNSQSKYEEAELMLRQALASREKVLGPDHPTTCASRQRHSETLELRNQEQNRRSLPQTPDNDTRMAAGKREKVLRALAKIGIQSSKLSGK